MLRYIHAPQAICLYIHIICLVELFSLFILFLLHKIPFFLYKILFYKFYVVEMFFLKIGIAQRSSLSIDNLWPFSLPLPVFYLKKKKIPSDWNVSNIKSGEKGRQKEGENPYNKMNMNFLSLAAEDERERTGKNIC
jgi:hypothetical protein